LRPVSPRRHGKSTAEAILADLTKFTTLGIDTSKDELVCCNFADPDQIDRVPNHPDAIRTWLSTFQGPRRIAIEPTSTYHLEVVEAAIKMGFVVYMINPRQLVHYREAVNEVNKTDPVDAYLLARYLDREVDQLRPHLPQDRRAQQLWTLLKRRATVVDTRKRLQQSLAGIKLPHKPMLRAIDAILKCIDLRMQKLLRDLGWWADYLRCKSIPGVGPLNATALIATYHRAAFSSVDQFISFIGLDIRLRESGHFKGKSKLTKRGEAELRRLLYCAAAPSRSYLPFKQFHQRQLDKGMPKIAANVVLARKIARIAFALIRKQENFIKVTKGVAIQA